MERDDNTGLSVDGTLAGLAQQLLGEHRAGFVETVLGELYTYVSSDA